MNVVKEPDIDPVLLLIKKEDTVNPSKAIIAVAGYGTRRLPISKAIEKCMLPILNRPVVDYLVEDCVKAGVTDIYFVVSDDARQLREYYSRDVNLEQYLHAKKKDELIELITPPENVTFHYITQDRNDPRYGTSVPVWLARDYISADEPFYVIMGDNCLWAADGSSQLQALAHQVIQADASAGMIGVEIERQLVGQYGVIDCTVEDIFRGIVEKPSIEAAPSNLINPSMYLFPGKFMKYIDQQMRAPMNGEYYITDAVNQFAQDGNLVAVYPSHAKYLDCGTLEHWVEANSWLFDRTKESD